MATALAEDDHGDALAMHRPAALTLRLTSRDPQDDADEFKRAPLTTPKKRWMLRWRLQHEQENEQETMLSKPESEGEAFVEKVLRQETATETKALHVKTPIEADSSASLSPSAMDHSTNDSAMVTAAPPSASISPSAKAKDSETVVRSRTPSPAKMLQVDKGVAPSAAPSSSSSSMTSTESAGNGLPTESAESAPLTLKRAQSEPSVPSSVAGEPNTLESTAVVVEKEERELTESERLRLERRKRRKSNWDVGDPRKHGGSVDLAALELLSSINPPASHPASFAKFPRHRSAYRHSQSLDTRDVPPPQQSQPPHRSPVFGNSTAVAAAGVASPPAPRRAFHHSNSLPLDRPRPTPR